MRVFNQNKGDECMSMSVKWDITYNCNLFCHHCIRGDVLNNKNKEPSLEEIKQIINRLSEKEVKYVHLLGGEPTVRKDFIEIINHFDNKGIPFGFNTNGLLIGKNISVCDVAHLSSFRNIVFSIESPIAEINDNIRGKEVFEKAEENLKKIISYKKDNQLDHFYITVNMVVGRVNKKYVLPMIDYCITLGVDELCLLQLIPQGNAQDKDMALTFDDELTTVKEIANIYPSVKDKIRIVPRFIYPLAIDYVNIVLEKEFPPVTHGCGAGTDFACITNQGILYPCERYEKEILKKNPEENLSLISNTFDEIWDRDGFSDIFTLVYDEKLYSAVSPCNNCNHLREACYPCPVDLSDTSKKEVSSCVHYASLIAEHKKKKNQIFHITDCIIRETRFSDEAYCMFNAETYETVTLNREAYLIWSEIKNMKSLQCSEAITAIKGKYDFSDADIQETFNDLIALNYLKPA